MGSLNFRILPPPAILHGDVACIHIAEYTGDEPVTIHTAPNAIPGIVFQHDNGRSALDQIMTRSGQYTTPTLFLYGAGTEQSTMHYRAGSYTTIHVIFKPHALHSLLGLNAATLTNSAAELAEFAPAQFHEQLMDAPALHDQVALLTNFLVTRREQAQRRDPAIEASLCQIHRHVATISVKQLRQTLYLSERQFERRFQQTVGISAQSYIRVKRFNEAVRLLKREQQTRLTDIAHALHFYDQAHFIREVKAFAGMTPKQLAQKTNDTYHDQIGYSHV